MMGRFVTVSGSTPCYCLADAPWSALALRVAGCRVFGGGDLRLCPATPFSSACRDADRRPAAGTCGNHSVGPECHAERLPGLPLPPHCHYPDLLARRPSSQRAA